MTVRTPLCFDGSALRPMTLAEINEWKEIEPGKCELLDFDFPKRED